MFKGTTTAGVEKKLIQYMEENIEPIGWQAIWRATQKSALSIFEIDMPIDIIVDVSYISCI